jgi:predicted branched-subunit amino acid permease
MAFLVATFVVFVVSERAIKAKHSQFIAGVGATNFWLSTFLWDALCFLIPAILIIIVVLAFQTSGYSDKTVAG